MSLSTNIDPDPQRHAMRTYENDNKRCIAEPRKTRIQVLSGHKRRFQVSVTHPNSYVLGSSA
jgi:hypothetical protein